MDQFTMMSLCLLRLLVLNMHKQTYLKFELSLSALFTLTLFCTPIRINAWLEICNIFFNILPLNLEVSRLAFQRCKIIFSWEFREISFICDKIWHLNCSTIMINSYKWGRLIRTRSTYIRAYTIKYFPETSQITFFSHLHWVTRQQARENICIQTNYLKGLSHFAKITHLLEKEREKNEKKNKNSKKNITK